MQHTDMGKILKLFTLLVSTCISLRVEKRNASPQFSSFPANNQNSQNPNFPPRFSLAGSQASPLANNQFSGSQPRGIPQQRQQQSNPPGFPPTETDRQRLAVLQGNSLRNQGLGGLRPAFEQQRPLSSSGVQQGGNNQFFGQPRQQDFVTPQNQQFSQSPQFSQPRPVQTQQLPQQRPLQQFSQIRPAQSQQQPQQQLSQIRPAQPRQQPQQQFLQSSLPQQQSPVLPQQFPQQLPSQQFTQTIQPQQFAQTPQFARPGAAQQLQPQQEFVSQPQSQSLSPSHPEQFLNQLSPEQKQKFLSQFEQLTQEQQIYAYSKFLSTPAEVQQFAIKQFLSLDRQVLAVSLQEEIRKEQLSSQQQLGQNRQQLPPQQFSQTQQQFLQSQQQQIPQVPQPQQFATNPQTLRQNERQPQASLADQLALRQQQEALQKIIDLQNSINFPNNV